MTNTTITNFRNNIFMYVNQAIKYNSPVNIATKEGNAVVISEEEYNGMLATLEIINEKGLFNEILMAKDAPEEDYISSEDIVWD